MSNTNDNLALNRHGVDSASEHLPSGVTLEVIMNKTIDWLVMILPHLDINSFLWYFKYFDRKLTLLWVRNYEKQSPLKKNN